jgi:hypothetical protein
VTKKVVGVFVRFRAPFINRKYQKQGILIKGEMTLLIKEQKIKNIKALSETTDRKINEFLNEDQKRI